jgi:hypothetical protein
LLRRFEQVAPDWTRSKQEELRRASEIKSLKREIENDTSNIKRHDKVQAEGGPPYAGLRPGETRADAVARLEKNKARLAELEPESFPKAGGVEGNATTKAGVESRPAERVLVGKSPQPYTVIERLDATAIEKENGEQPIKVRNERTGEESIVLENQTRAIKAKDGTATDIDNSNENQESKSGEAVSQGDEADARTGAASVVENLQSSGRVLWTSEGEINEILLAAAGATPRNRTEQNRDTVRSTEFNREGGGIDPGEKVGRRGDFEKTRIFIERGDEASIRGVDRRILLLAHRILFGTSRPGESGPVSARFIQSLSERLPNLKFSFNVFAPGSARTAARYVKGTNGSFDFIEINIPRLLEYSLDDPADLATWDAAISEELLHAVTFRSNTRQEIGDVWRSLTRREQEKVAEAYKKLPDDDVSRGAEYIRIILQERLTGTTSEIENPAWRVTDVAKRTIRNIIGFLRDVFGIKPENALARRVIERLEAMVRGEAPIKNSIYDDSFSVGTSIDRTLADDVRSDDYVTTEMFGQKYGVLSKPQWTPEQREKSREIARAAYDEAGLTVIDATDFSQEGDEGHLQVVPTSDNLTTEGRRLATIVRREVKKYGQGSFEVTHLINSLRINFHQGRLESMDLPVRNALFMLAQSAASFRGTALAALRGAGEDLRFVSQNIDVHLQRIWHEAYGGTHIDKVLEKLRAKWRAIFTQAMIRDIVNSVPELAKVKDAENLATQALDSEFSSLTELRDTLTKLLTENGVDPKQAANLSKQFIEAFRPKAREAGEKATKETEKELTPDEILVVKGKKPIWEKIVTMVMRGDFDNAPLVREKAKQNGWRPPSDDEIARIKRLAERERELHKLTKREIDDAKGNEAKLRKDQVVRDEATLPQRLPLMRQMEAAWGSITRPVSFKPWRWFGESRANNAAFVNELVSANLLLRLSFAPKQALSVFSQFMFHVPTRSIAQALQLHAQQKSLGKQTALRKDVYNSLTGAYKSAFAGFKDGAAQFVAALRGRGEARNVDRLMSGIAAIERIDAQAARAQAEGKTGQAILYRVAALIRLGYRIAQAFDNLHGVPSEYIELRHQAVNHLMKNGVERAAANARADQIIDSIKASNMQAIVEAKAFMDANDMKYTPEILREVSYRIARKWAYETLRGLGMPADEFMVANKDLRETIGWNEREAGTNSVGGGVGGLVVTAGKTAEKLGIPLAMGRFGNAIAIGINRALHFTPLGFFPGAFGDNNAWFKTELDRNQRKIEAAVGSALGSILFMLALSGIFVVRLRWPKDPEERDLWEAQGIRPGTLEIHNGDGTFSAWSLNTGMLQYFAPYLAAGGALRDTLNEREKQQAKLDADAAKNGLPPEEIRPLSMADMAGVALQSGYQTILGGRTAAGLVGSIADYGTPNVTKTAASQIAPLIPTLPAFQEISRMSGVVLDSKMASFGDFLLPLPSSPARRVNFLGDPAGTPDDLQRIVQVLTGGSYPLVDSNDAKMRQAYSVLFASDFRPPSINPNKGYAIGSSFRPFTDSELENYSVLRGQEFKNAVSSLSPNASESEVRAAYQTANNRALSRMGVNIKMPKARTAKSRRSRRFSFRRASIRNLRNPRRKLRSLRFA